jgi:hypothetical protein
MYINIAITILDSIHRPQLYRFVLTSQKTLYVSATSPTG